MLKQVVHIDKIIVLVRYAFCLFLMAGLLPLNWNLPLVKMPWDKYWASNLCSVNNIWFLTFLKYFATSSASRHKKCNTENSVWSFACFDTVKE